MRVLFVLMSMVLASCGNNSSGGAVPAASAGNAATPVTRTVNVTDQTAPVITLKGASVVTVAQGAAYVDAGSVVTDNYSTGLVATMTGTMNTALMGTYTLTYNVKDAAGNAALPVTRTVNVGDQTAPIITVPANLVVTMVDGYGVASTDPYIAAFLNGASAKDNVDPISTVSNNAPLMFASGVTVVTFSSTDTAGNTRTATASVTVQGRLFVGVSTATLTLGGVAATEAIAWEGLAGHKVHRVHKFYDFTSPAFLWTEVDATLAAGYPVMLTLQPTLGDPYSRLVDTYTGVMDPYIDASINGIKGLQAAWPNADIWIRFGHEMNGDWYPWGAGFNQGTAVRHLGNTPQDYINAYRHVVDRFRAAGIGSNMVKWVFAPNVWPTDNFSEYYPGDAYVDMISTSGFNFGPSTALHPTLTWQMFNTIHQFTYNQMTTLHPLKPYFIGGISSAELGGSKAAWVDDMSLQLQYNYPKMTGIFWFNINKKPVGEANWLIDSSPASLAAIQRMYGTAGLWKP